MPAYRIFCAMRECNGLINISGRACQRQTITCIFIGAASRGSQFGKPGCRYLHSFFVAKKLTNKAVKDQRFQRFPIAVLQKKLWK